jgi:hypothetical protein
MRNETRPYLYRYALWYAHCVAKYDKPYLSLQHKCVIYIGYEVILRCFINFYGYRAFQGVLWEHSCEWWWKGDAIKRDSCYLSGGTQAPLLEPKWALKESEWDAFQL